MKKIAIVLSSMVISLNVYALSPEAIEGKALFAACDVCHNPTMEKPLGPPMWGVQRRYKNNTIDKEDFVKSMVSFVKAPSLESAIHDQAIEQLGLMPAMPLPDDMLTKITSYIFEEQFPPPCEHWQHGLKISLKKGDTEHAEKEQRQIDRFCK